MADKKPAAKPQTEKPPPDPKIAVQKDWTPQERRGIRVVKKA